ncbi:MAG: hypothetical protein HYZ95_03565 [Candidatus Omnitrophica bacterium]|nr:hypothetical protein [Candidatus Omnitrophota bacterium]
MTRAQVQQIVVIVLLMAFGAVWAATRQGTAPAPSAPATAPAPDAAAPREGPQTESPLWEGAGAEAVSLARDLFGLPSRLHEKIRERERALELERQRLQGQPAPQPVPVETQPPLELSTLDLQGIFWGTDRPQAIINRRILSVGDTIDGAEIAAIREEGVTLTYGEQKVELKPSAEIRTEEEEGGGRDTYPNGR